MSVKSGVPFKLRYQLLYTISPTNLYMSHVFIKDKPRGDINTCQINNSLQC